MTDRTPRVLFVADKFGYPNGVAYGGTTYFLNVLPELARAGVSFTPCFLRDYHPTADALHAFGITPIFLGARRMDPSVFLRLAWLAREHRCEVIHATGIKATLMARAAARLVPARVIVHVHDLLHPGAVIHQLHRMMARDSDLGLCVSSAVIPTAMQGYHVRQGRTRVVHNGIQLESFREGGTEDPRRVRDTLGLAEGDRIIGMIARMYPVKGHRAMLEMMPEIVRRVPRARLLLVGDGTERRACERVVSELGLGSHVTFLGQRSDIARLLSICDLTVMPSESEGFPLSAIESLAMGTPVVAFDVGGLGEVVEDGVSGRLVPFGDARSFVDAVVSLLDDVEGPDLYAARARRAAERFSVEHHVRQLVDCYREQVVG